MHKPPPHARKARFFCQGNTSLAVLEYPHEQFRRHPSWKFLRIGRTEATKFMATVARATILRLLIASNCSDKLYLLPSATFSSHILTSLTLYKWYHHEAKIQSPVHLAYHQSEPLISHACEVAQPLPEVLPCRFDGHRSLLLQGEIIVLRLIAL